jgi:hypothetical protein
MSRVKTVRKQWTCPKCAKTLVVSRSGIMSDTQKAHLSATLASNLMRQRIQHKQANCKDGSSGDVLFKTSVAAVGLFTLAKIFS